MGIGIEVQSPRQPWKLILDLVTC